MVTNVCYTYASNNPVRYTDPSGFFEEDQIMQYLGVNTWDEVLTMFEAGRFAGAWGWLEVLREAELGDNIEVWNHNQPYLAGTFSDEGGQLMFSSSINGTDVNWSANDSIGLAAYGGNPNVSYWVKGANQSDYVANLKHTHIVDRGVDWGGVALAGTGVILDIASGGTAGIVVDIGKTGSTVLDLTFLTVDGLKIAESINRGEFSVGETGETVFWDAFGFVPVVGDTSYIGYQFATNLYIGP